MIKNIFKKAYLSFILFFIYVPIFVMIVLSFNNSKSRVHWDGFTLKWYLDILKDRDIMPALQNTVIIALMSSIIAVIIGTLAAIGISHMRNKKRSFYMMVTNIPMLNADIATGISLMLFFKFFGERFNFSLSFYTILLAHITFNIPYVILSVLPKINKYSRGLFDAARDLGANELQAFFKIMLPELMPGIVSGFMLSLTMSLDDFVITHFTKGAGVNTLSTLIYSQVRRGVKPSMYALSTIIFAVVLIVLIVTNIISRRNENLED